MSLFKKLSKISRQNKKELFYKTMEPNPESKLLDVGGECDYYGRQGLQLIEHYPWKNNLTIINISEQHIKKIKDNYPEVNAIVADACNLPFDDKQFDIVYSNAVIEHVGDFERQKKMASEILRVSKKYFVTTPNRWYPFEFHMRLPFVTWLPFHGYRQFRRLLTWNHDKKRYSFANSPGSMRLLDQRELKKCFPGCRIIRNRVTFMAETLIAINGDIQ